MNKVTIYLLLLGASLLLLSGCTMPQVSQSSYSGVESSVADNDFAPYEVFSDGSSVFLKGELFSYSYCFFDQDGSFMLELSSENKDEYPVVSDISDGAVIVRYISDDGGLDVGSRYGLLAFNGLELTEPKYNCLFIEPNGMYIIGLYLSDDNYIQLDLFDIRGTLLDSYHNSRKVQSANMLFQDINPYNCSVVITGETDEQGTDYCEIVYYRDGKLNSGHVFLQGEIFFPRGRDFGEVVFNDGTVAYQKYDGTPIDSLVGVCSSSDVLGVNNRLITVFQPGLDCLLVSEEGRVTGKINGTSDASEIICAGDYVFSIYANPKDAWIKAYFRDGSFVKDIPLVINADIAGGAYVSYENGLYSVSDGNARRYYDEGLNEVESELAKGFECGRFADGRILIMSQRKNDSIRYAPSGDIVDSFGNPLVVGDYSISAQVQLFDWSMPGVAQRVGYDIFCAKDRNGNYGAVDTYGDVVIPFDFEDVHVGGQGTNCLVKFDNKWHVFDIETCIMNDASIKLHS